MVSAKKAGKMPDRRERFPIEIEEPWTIDQRDSTRVMKRENRASKKSILRESAMHDHILQCFAASWLSVPQTHINIPRHLEIVHEFDTQWWEMHKWSFSPDAEHCNTLIVERILPFDGIVRQNLADFFCHVYSQERVRAGSEHGDCLIRPFLGREKQASWENPWVTLNKMPLPAAAMDVLSLPIRDYARVMADALAILYWVARVDANDVEFVLAPKGLHRESGAWQTEFLGTHTLWLYSVDSVGEMSMDQSGIEQAAAAFLWNDPYFPRPDAYFSNPADAAENHLGRELWQIFSKQFVHSSTRILGDCKLPLLFLNRVEWMCQEQKRQLHEQMVRLGEQHVHKHDDSCDQDAEVGPEVSSNEKKGGPDNAETKGGPDNASAARSEHVAQPG